VANAASMAVLKARRPGLWHDFIASSGIAALYRSRMKNKRAPWAPAV